MLLRRGSKGPEVRDLQQRLYELGYSPGPVDGIFGPRTEEAVKAFQRDSGLLTDGIVGPRTRADLEAPQCRQTSRPVQPSAPRPPRQEMPGPPGEPRWLIIARREICTREARLGSEPNPRIEAGTATPGEGDVGGHELARMRVTGAVPGARSVPAGLAVGDRLARFRVMNRRPRR